LARNLPNLLAAIAVIAFTAPPPKRMLPFGKETERRKTLVSGLPERLN
jgi:hypothetical protein